MRHKVRDLGVFFCLAVMLFTVTSCGKEVSDQTIAATEQSSEERRDAEAVMGTETVETFSTEKAGTVGIPDGLVYAAVIHVEINPEFNLYVDAEECIVYVEYLNEDAADLFETVDLTGQKLADGMETIVDAAEEKGYLTGQNEVTTDVVWVQEATDSGKLEKVLQTISDSSGKKTCSACGGTGICAECGGGTLPCKRCHGSLVETCSNCDTSGMQTCPGCKGSGVDATDGSACRHCGGAGKIVCELCGGSHGKPCSICHGKGVITDDCILCHGAKKCTLCGGSGKV
ncbi:MAG: anti-sigma-I factor RsgI family protein [Roseburia inulinivorans]